MKSIIICEGSTDFVITAIFYARAHQWEDYRKPDILNNNFKMIRELKRGTDSLLIGGAGGCSRIIPCADYIFQLEHQQNSLMNVRGF